MQLLKEISLSGFLSYGNQVSINLLPLNIIVGPNGSGKSNLIEAIDLFHNAPTELLRSIREGGGVSDWLWKGDKMNNNAIVELLFQYDNIGEQNLRYTLAFNSEAQRFVIADERIENEKPIDKSHPNPYFFYHFNSGRPYLNVSGKTGMGRRRNLQAEDIDFEKSILSQRKDPDQYPEITWISKQLQNIYIYRDWNFGRYTAPRIPQKADLPNTYLEHDCSNLGLVLNKLSMNPNVKTKIISALQEVNGEIQDFTVHIEGGTVQVFIQEAGMMIPATRISDGTLRFLCLLAVLCHPSPPPLICIEEPELGLHPDVISVLARLLLDASERTQIVITTHSAMLIDYFTDMPEYVIVADKTCNGSSLKRFTKEQLLPWLGEYSLGNLWLQGEIGGVRW